MIHSGNLYRRVVYSSLDVHSSDSWYGVVAVHAKLKQETDTAFTSKFSRLDLKPRVCSQQLPFTVYYTLKTHRGREVPVKWTALLLSRVQYERFHRYSDFFCPDFRWPSSVMNYDLIIIINLSNELLRPHTDTHIYIRLTHASSETHESSSSKLLLMLHHRVM